MKTFLKYQGKWSSGSWMGNKKIHSNKYPLGCLLKAKRQPPLNMTEHLQSMTLEMEAWTRGSHCPTGHRAQGYEEVFSSHCSPLQPPRPPCFSSGSSLLPYCCWLAISEAKMLFIPQQLSSGSPRSNPRAKDSRQVVRDRVQGRLLPPAQEMRLSRGTGWYPHTTQSLREEKGFNGSSLAPGSHTWGESSEESWSCGL